MKKIIIVTLLNIIFICLFALSGCSFDNTYYEISTVEELYAMESDKNYQLTCDIDLKEREWYPLGVRGFNGNGFTISNCYIGEIYKIQHGIAVNDYSVYMGFFGRVDKLENVVFDNININYSVVNDELGNFGIAGGVVGCASNVCIKNSSAFFKITYDYAYAGILAGHCSEFSNCLVENSKLNCEVTPVGSFYIGGMVGYASQNNVSIKNNIVRTSKILCDSKGYMNCGGIIGYFDSLDGKIINCTSNNNIMDLRTSTSTTSRAGGIVGCSGEKGDISFSTSIYNNIKLKSSYGYNLGGIVGKTESKVSNCLSDSNVIEGITSSNESKQYAGIGGLCGSNSATISKSVAQNNKILGTYSTKSNSMFAAGFVASADASIVNCAGYNNTVSGGNKDVFAGKSDDLLINCYLAEVGQTSPNINKLSVLTEEEWLRVLEILSLDDEIWTLENGLLDLKIVG